MPLTVECPTAYACHASAGALQACLSSRNDGRSSRVQAVRFMGAMRDRLLDPGTRFQWDQVRGRGRHASLNLGAAPACSGPQHPQ